MASAIEITLAGGVWPATSGFMIGERWEWKVTFVSTDGIVVDTVWVDAQTGESNRSMSTTGGGSADP